MFKVRTGLNYREDEEMIIIFLLELVIPLCALYLGFSLNLLDHLIKKFIFSLVNVCKMLCSFIL